MYAEPQTHMELTPAVAGVGGCQHDFWQVSAGDNKNMAVVSPMYGPRPSQVHQHTHSIPLWANGGTDTPSRVIMQLLELSWGLPKFETIRQSNNIRTAMTCTYVCSSCCQLRINGPCQATEVTYWRSSHSPLGQTFSQVITLL